MHKYNWKIVRQLFNNVYLKKKIITPSCATHGLHTSNSGNRTWASLNGFKIGIAAVNFNHFLISFLVHTGLFYFFTLRSGSKSETFLHMWKGHAKSKILTIPSCCKIDVRMFCCQDEAWNLYLFQTSQTECQVFHTKHCTTLTKVNGQSVLKWFRYMPGLNLKTNKQILHWFMVNWRLW